MKHIASNAPSSLAGPTTLILYIVLGCLLTSCQTGVYRGYDGYLHRVPPELMYNQYPKYSAPVSNPVPRYTYPPPVAPQVKSKTRTPVAVASRQPSNFRPVRSQSGHVMPPIPNYGYHARWDTRPTVNSPNGLFWVVNPSGQVSGLPPDKFWPFWADCIYKGVPIKVFDQYDPNSRF